MTIQRILASLCAALGLAGTGVSAQTADFPNRPITLQVGFSAGGPTDRQFRLLAQLASKTLGQPIVVESKPGAAGTLASSSLAMGGRPDGYTIAQAPVGVFRIPHLQKVAWDPTRDFSYIIGLAGYVMGIAVRADSEFKNWNDVLNYARANPGKLTYASTGVGGTLHLAMEDIASRTGLKFNHIPYKGAADSARALLAGEVMLQADAVSGFTALADAGKARVLMVWEPERYVGLPNVPTARELGIDIVYQSPYGLIGPKGMAPETITRLHDAFKKALDDPEHLKLLGQINQSMWYQSPKAYADYAAKAWVQERLLMERAGLLPK
jgi:tripartite-type tricarboxylate transporter receptor subunit TctC